MTQVVFIHGPGAGGCADSYVYQLEHYPGSLAPHLPGHLDGAPCSNVERYTDWLRGWLHAQGHDHDLVLSGFTLGACIAMQYALDYPEEVKGLALMTIAMRPKQRRPGDLQFRLDAAENDETHDKWLGMMDGIMHFIEPDLRGRLLQRHREVGPVAQYQDLVAIDHFDVRDRIHSLKTPLLLVQGVDDPLATGNYEEEIHRAVPGSKLIKMKAAGHFPMVEKPDEFNGALDAFLAEID
ncbi:MAG: alpha/beta hydrolase [Chloroflexi bacterium]|nr:alpha/beta hydrolase [Chloroflexota bacterium]